jgi:hypothetical protein
MTISDYKTLIQNEADDSSSRASAIIERAIKDVYQEIIRYCIEGLVSTSEEDITATIGTSEYTPSAFLDIKKVLWKPTNTTNYSILPQVKDDEYYNKFINRDNSTPAYYSINGNKIRLMPTPDEAGTLKVVYWAVQPELIGSQVSIIPARFTNTMILGSLARFMAYERLPDADNYKADYQQAIAEMIRELGTKGENLKINIYA